MRRTILALLMILCAQGLARAHGARVEVVRASIECGGTDFSAVTHLLYYSGISQTITALLPGAAVARTVELRETSFVTHRDKPAIRVVAFYVDSWQCRQTPSGQVLVLWYNCADNYPDAPEQSCIGRNEWQRYISSRGAMLDGGFSIDDPRYVTLRATLGYRDGSPDPQDGEASFAVIAARPEISRNTMRCGGTEFSAETVKLDLATISQTIVARPQGREPGTLDLREQSFVLHHNMPGLRMVAAAVTAWQCQKTPTGHVLELWYSVPELFADWPPREFYSPDKEWQRYVSTEGDLLDRGYGVDDPRYDALRVRLGHHDPSSNKGDSPFVSIP